METAPSFLARSVEKALYDLRLSVSPLRSPDPALEQAMKRMEKKRSEEERSFFAEVLRVPCRGKFLCRRYAFLKASRDMEVLTHVVLSRLEASLRAEIRSLGCKLG